VIRKPQGPFVKSKFYFVALRIVLASLACQLSAGVHARSYHTDFPLAENPVSENGNWINGRSTGLDWADVAVTNGMALGLESGFTGYDDATALLTGSWGSNQTASAVVFATNRMSGNVYEEVEIRLCSSLSAHNCDGYEVNFSLRPDASAYVQIVRWNGPLGSFDYVNATGGSQCILHTGDTITGTVTNHTITAYINGSLIVQGTDTNFTGGNPGVGIFIQGASGVNRDYGFTSYTATDGLPVPPPRLKISGPDNGVVVLRVFGVPGTVYQIQRTDSPGAAGWQSLGNVFANGSGVATLTNSPPPGSAQQFYRAVLP
jgi:hypothetical protein